MSVRCEEVRELLPEYAEWGPRPAGAVEVHVASCARCSAELDSYRQMLSSLAEMRRHEEEPPAGYLERTLALVPATRNRIALSGLPGRVIETVKRRPAAASLTGAAIGVAAIGVVAWRLGRRAQLREPLPVPTPG